MEGVNATFGKTKFFYNIIRTLSIPHFCSQSLGKSARGFIRCFPDEGPDTGRVKTSVSGRRNVKKHALLPALEQCCLFVYTFLGRAIFSKGRGAFP